MVTTEETLIEEILTEARKIAVVGYSNKPHRAGHYVPAYLREQGYEIIPVNPYETAGLGAPAYDSLDDVPGPVDLVLIFRRIDAVAGVVEQAIQQKARWVWMQIGVVHEQAAQEAEAAGLGVVQNRCMLVEHKRRVPH